MDRVNISVVIPSYNRTKILLNTIEQLLEQDSLASQIIVVDQTNYQANDLGARRLTELDSLGKIQWIRQEEASIPKAMNRGMTEATADYVLFLDDDVTFSNTFLTNHQKVIDEQRPLAHVGQIVQPWQTADADEEHKSDSREITLNKDLSFAFNSSSPARIQNCMAGNLCVNRKAAIAVGGFDENFSKIAYRFETEFCKRLCGRYQTLFYYAPAPVLNHLHVSSGGTRAHADFLTSASPEHSFGDYYYAMLLGKGAEKYRYILARLFSSVKAKFYLTKPWYIPFRIVGELRGLKLARVLSKSGQKFIEGADDTVYKLPEPS